LQVTGALPDPELEVAEVAAGAAAAGAAALPEVPELAPPDADLSMPPCPRQAPRPPLAELVPSLQVTGPLDEPDDEEEVDEEPEVAAGAAAGAAALPEAAVLPEVLADLSMPPWPRQAPRPPLAEVVPSLQVTGLLLSLVVCASDSPGAAMSAAANTAPHIKPLNLAIFICRSPPERDRCYGTARIPQRPQARARHEAAQRTSRCSLASMNTRTVMLLGFITFLSCFVPRAHAEWMERTEAIMGTRIYVELWAEDAEKGNEAIEAVMADMRRIDNLMSHYKPESELSLINAHAYEAPVRVDKELFDLIKLSTHSQLTDGAFDITYASVGYLYDYRRHIHPSEAQIKSALPAVNWRNLLFDEKEHSVRFEHAGMRIDLGGIGKGYAVDHGIELLKARGFRHAVVTAGGDTGIIGDHMGRPWLVAIRHPDDPSKVVTRIPLSDSAMSTSGDYERYFDENGVRYHHIIDPHTGHSASKVRSATVIAPTATQTDGMSKTAFVLGPEKALEIINRLPDYDAVFVCPDGRVLYSKGLRPPAARPADAPAATAASRRVPP
jgi:FAD:protein FMN transferase